MSPRNFDANGIQILVGGTGEKRTLRTLAKYGDIMNLDGWSGVPMTAETLRHKINVLNAHCEQVGRDPSDITHTVLMPTMVSDDKEKVAAFVNGRRLGLGSATGPKNYVIDRIGEIIDAGADGIMIGGIPTDNSEDYEQLAEDVLSHFS